MSKEALNAFYRLQVRPKKLCGTDTAMLLYLALRHDSKRGYAYPSIKTMCDDLDMFRSRRKESIERLKSLRLVFVEEPNSRGRGNFTKYRLPWVGMHMRDPRSKESILIGEKEGAGRSDPFETPKGSESCHEKGPMGDAKNTAQVRTNNIKTIKTADERFAEALAKQSVTDRRG